MWTDLIGKTIKKVDINKHGSSVLITTEDNRNFVIDTEPCRCCLGDISCIDVTPVVGVGN